MRTRIGEANPHSHNRYGYAYERVRQHGSEKHLDVGCYDGRWLAALSCVPSEGRWGVDLNRDAIARGTDSNPELNLRWSAEIGTLPFADGQFDSVSMLDVLEHLDVDHQSAALREFCRVLRTDGLLVVTVPGQHLFSFLDMGNLKFRFPAIHRAFYIARHGRSDYEYRYVNNPFGLVGDVMATKRWHEHFSVQRLSEILAKHGFRVVDVDGAGLFMRPLAVANLLSARLLGAAFRRLIAVDSRVFQSANLFVSAMKTAQGPTDRVGARA